ncbi:MAG: UDP-N-acetylmuramate--L-alanine ligase [bacterium]
MKIHFIGIGGAGMSALATICLASGNEVSGSDISENEAIRRLRSWGAKIYTQHSPDNVHDAELVVYSSAIAPGNAELVEARKRGIPTIKRGELLAQLMRDKKGIVIAGTHGKTTTSSLVSLMLERNGLDPTIIIGGEVHDIGGNAKLGRSDFFVAEADESDGSFLFLTPWIAVITNIDSDHLDYYGSMEELVSAFSKFSYQVKEDGYIVACYDDPYIKGLKFPRPTIYYGLSPEAHLWADEIKVSENGTSCRVNKGEQEILQLNLQLLGRQNVYNALAATSVGLILGIDLDDIKSSLESLRGVHRRLERIGSYDDILVYDDYAHHPTEISATLRTLKEAFPQRRIVCAFQPHRYTRTHLLHKELASALCEADVLILTSIYPAGEEPIENVSSHLILSSLESLGKNALYLENLNDIPDCLFKLSAPGDIILTLGAGNIDRCAYQLLEKARDEKVKTNRKKR